MQLTWTSEMQEALNSFNRINQVTRAYGQPLPLEDAIYPAPPMMAGNYAFEVFKHQQHFAIWIALASPEDRAAYESIARADMVAWKQKTAVPLSRIDSSKIIINI